MHDLSGSEDCHVIVSQELCNSCGICKLLLTVELLYCTIIIVAYSTWEDLLLFPKVKYDNDVQQQPIFCYPHSLLAIIILNTQLNYKFRLYYAMYSSRDKYRDRQSDRSKCSLFHQLIPFAFFHKLIQVCTDLRNNMLKLCHSQHSHH